MSTPSRPNFFLLLELNPDEPWDEGLYQKTIEEKVRQWSYESLGIAKKALPAQFYRGLLPQIRQVMEDPRARAQEARGASALLATRYQKEYQRFEGQLLLLNLKEVVDQEEMEAFVKEFRHIVPARTIERRIKSRIRQAAQGDDAVERVLEPSIAKNIEDHLALVQVETLYELLHMSSTEATPLLLQEAEKLYAREVRQHPSAAVTARVELAGFAMMIFKTDEMRARYDETLRQVGVQQVLEELTQSARRSRVKEIHARQVLYYLERVQEMGVSREKALERLKEHGRIHQWFLVVPATEREGEEGESEADEGERGLGGIGAGGAMVVQESEHVGRGRGLVINRDTWRRIRAIVLVLVQLIFLLLMTQRDITLTQPLTALGNLAHGWLFVPLVAIVRQALQTQFSFAGGSVIVRSLVAVIAVMLVVLIDVVVCVVLITCAIPVVFALLGLLVGGVSGLKGMVEIFFRMHIGMQENYLSEDMTSINYRGWIYPPVIVGARDRQEWVVDVMGEGGREKDSAGSGWVLERRVAENLAVALYKRGQCWSEFADLLAEWKWMRGCLIAYWMYPIRFGCGLAGLTHAIMSVELDALCTCVYTVTLLIGEMAVFVSSVFTRVLRR